jgi:hypothetical protein
LTLARFAYRHAGPLDAAIIFPINLAFPLYFLWGRASVPLWGWDGWAPFLVTAGFFVGLFPTISGMNNGINFQRCTLGSEYEPRPHWLRWAIARGLLLGTAQAAIIALSLWLLQRVWPELTLGWLTISVANAGISAVLGYFAQARGVLAST